MQFPAQTIQYTEQPVPVLLVASASTLFSIRLGPVGSESAEIKIADAWTSSAKSYITVLHPSTQSPHVVLATAEDKSLVVLEISQDGKFSELSKRALPKRPSAVIISPDNRSIICGDKFGDVYSLPLIPSPDWVPPSPPAPVKKVEVAETTSTPDSNQDAGSASTTTNGTDNPSAGAVPFKPTASTSTVHTGANLRALQSQMQQKIFSAPKEEPTAAFEHELLLGHVSLLTDLVWTVDQSTGRNYLITADRDEHIRVSRAPPQAYVTENYCLGHTSFVNKLCAVKAGDLLISGGGDNFLAVWDWKHGQMRGKISLQPVLEHLASAEQGGDETMRRTNTTEDVVTVTGLHTTVDSNGSEILLISVAHSPNLYSFPLAALENPSGELSISRHPLPHNVLSVTSISPNFVLVSTDPSSEASETTESTERPSIHVLDISAGSSHCDRSESAASLASAIAEAFSSSELVPQLTDAEVKEARSHLYSAVALRKRVQDYKD